MGLAKLVAPWFLRRAGHGEYLRYLQEAEALQWRSPQEIQQVQWQRLQRLLDHAREKVPYYSKLFATHQFRAGSFQSRADLSRIPVLTKTDIQQNEDALIAAGIDKATLTWRRSSGSTGKPTKIYLDTDRGNHSWAYNTRHNRWAGLDWGSRVGSMWGLPINPPDSEPSGLRGRWQGWMSHAMGIPREEYLNPYEYSDAEMQRFVERLVRFQPDVLLGYTNSLYFLAKYVHAAGVRGIHPRGIICGGEALHAEGRQLLESVFDSKVFLRYGSREADIIASECEHGRMHVNDDNLLVEVLTESGEAFGRVLVTDLWNFVMPLIRYDLEDVASWADGPCPCGRGLSILAGVEGRKSEMFRTQDGRTVSGLWFTSFMREIPELSRYQVHQTGYKTFRIRIVTDSDRPPEEILRPAIVQIKGRFGEDTAIQITREVEIRQVGTGKFRFLISDVR